MSLQLEYNLQFGDLYDTAGLQKIDTLFCDFLQTQRVDLFNRLMAARAGGFAAKMDESDLITSVAPLLEEFIGDLFGVTREISALKSKHSRLSPIYECKRQFVQRRAAKKYKPADAQTFDSRQTIADAEKYFGSGFGDLEFASKVLNWLIDETANKDAIAAAEKYAAWALYHPDGMAAHKKGVLFRLPHKIDPLNLVPVETEIKNGYRILKLPRNQLRTRDGFKLTDNGADLELALDQANYCIFCHNQGKDSCSTGMKDKSSGEFQKTTNSVDLTGCPLDEKISEMNMMKAAGNIVGSLAIAAIDNPLCAMTGHRICNDCMKSCIYQKQQPVDIPQIETRVLKDVLELPWGFEIYSLLTRWNPLNAERPLPGQDTAKKILVVGAGPAGINLSHHLLNDGHYVCLIDGLKIEPLNIPFQPIFDATELWEDLDRRVMAGFGGVAEYGITVRWDKNFLKIARLILERRRDFDLIGGVRFGGTITAEQAFAMGFDHIALCMGAGRPSLLDIPGNLSKGVRAASDFLMGLQLTGAGKKDSLANLQVRLPAIVIGGGLTAVDTATEIMAYYPLQVEKFLSRFESLSAQIGENAVRRKWNAEDTAIADEFMAHARALRAEKQKTSPDIIGLLQSWGGATICYRRDFINAPSYTLNHEEVHKAMEEGIFFAPNLTPFKINTDQFNWVSEMVFDSPSGQIAVPARSVMVAAGTQPNTVLAREDLSLRLELDGKYFKAYDESGNPIAPQKSAKPKDVHIFMHQDKSGRKISFFGDLHPSFSGNVVKAMASAKRGYKLITKHLANLPNASCDKNSLRQAVKNGCIATIHAVNRLTANIIEVVIHAPFAAKNFNPGQFYRLQNFESGAGVIDGTRMATESLAMTGAWVDADKGLLATVILEMGGSSSLCARWNAGDKIILMGPTGTPTHIPQNEKVILVGGGLGNAVLFSIGKAMRAAGCHVIYFAGYKNPQDRFKPDDIQSAADCVVWCGDVAPAILPSRPQDRNFTGNIVEAMHANSDLLSGADRIICIGSDRMMAAVAAARHGVLAEYLPKTHVAIGSINSPMQCMMKEICAQCIQRHIDPETGREKIVFSCFDQDQNMDSVDWKCLNDRLAQNGVHEKLTAAWIAQINAN